MVVVVVVVLLVRVLNLPLVLGRLLEELLRVGASVLSCAAGFLSLFRLEVLDGEILLSEALGGGGLLRTLATTSSLWL